MLFVLCATSGTRIALLHFQVLYPPLGGLSGQTVLRVSYWCYLAETPGEDSYLSGEYAAHFVDGMQNSAVDPSHWQAGATCKHFVRQLSVQRAPRRYTVS